MLIDMVQDAYAYAIGDHHRCLQLTNDGMQCMLLGVQCGSYALKSLSSKQSADVSPMIILMIKSYYMLLS